MANTYAISDIHACYDQLQQLLDKVSPTSEDRIFVLGDLCDRGPKPAETLLWAANNNNPNVQFLLGNHDEMLLTSLRRNPKSITLRWGDTWAINGGHATIIDIAKGTDPDWRATVLLPFMEALLPYKHINVNGTDMMLVHAGFNPNSWNHEEFTPVDVMPGDDAHDIGYGFGKQDTQTMTWIRQGWYDYEGTCPLPTIYGHTQVPYLSYLAQRFELFATALTKDRWFVSDIAPDSIWHYRDRINIDCGCAYGGRLAALRLNDMEEFYVDGYESNTH